MRHELTDHEWAVIRSMLPNKARGVPRVNDRRVLNGIFWVLRSGAPWRDLPQSFGPYTTCYNRFVRWRRAGVWSRIIGQLLTALVPVMAGVGNNVDIGALASQAVGGGVAGAIVAAIVGLIKSKMG
jgi:transposase